MLLQRNRLVHPEYPDYYVYRDGRVWSKLTHKFLKPTKKDGNYDYGYYIFHLKNYKGEFVNVYHHRLVAEVFIPNPLNLPEVNHKDEDKSNCSASNLEWCTMQYNACYGSRLNKFRKPILQYSLEGDFIKEWDSQSTASRILGISQPNLSQCLNPNSYRKSCGGYKWKYKEVMN